MAEGQSYVGTDGDDNVTGDAHDNVIFGGKGDDFLVGGSGADTFMYRAGHGNDVIGDFNPEEDVLDVSFLAGLDSDYGAGLIPSIEGYQHWIRHGKEEFWQKLSNRITVATDPDDPGTITGLQLDLSDWGSGTIIFRGLSPGDLTMANFDTGHVEPSPGRYSDTVTGTDSGETLYGYQGDDEISGKGGDDRLDGGSGDDRLDGGRGDDTLVGGMGRDTFVFEPGGGDDRVTDFTNGEDKIDLSAFSRVFQLSDLTASQVGENLLLDLSDHGGGTITLENVALADLDDADFVFCDVPMDDGV